MSKLSERVRRKKVGVEKGGGPCERHALVHIPYITNYSDLDFFVVKYGK